MFRYTIGWVAILSFFLTSCVTPGMSGRVGPKTSGELKAVASKQVGIAEQKLDIIVPVFDPGIPETDEEMAEERIWPELRRAESVRFALKLKEELEKTGQFGAVRVTPDAEATGDIYVMGEILESNGKDVDFRLDVYDIAGNRWYSDSYDHEVGERFYTNIRNQGKDPYQPAFQEAAADLVERLKSVDAGTIALLQKVTEMRFANNFSEDAFKEHLREEDGRFELVSLPAETDPMLERVRAIRIRDQLYVDNLQTHYQEFNNKMETSYMLWQEKAREEQVAFEEAETAATGRAIAGGLLMILAIGLAAAAGNSGNSGRSTAAMAGGIAAGVGAAAAFSGAFRSNEESKLHADTLDEMGQSIDGELAPQVVEFEGKTKELTGSAAKQFADWRAFLKTIYEQEKTPVKQL